MSSRFNATQSPASLSENFCLIGTPLPPLDSAKSDPNELKPLWEQEVLDERGRKRFHGAFTGGFSAGYFNTVGSEQGWTPSTFLSSRSAKKQKANDGTANKQGSKIGASRPEDFMDEEDLEDLREKRQLTNNLGFQHHHNGIEASDRLGDEEDPLSTLLKSNPRSQSESIGVSILKKMGWKEGHGLGPKLTFSKRRKLFKLLGMEIPSEDENLPESILKGREKEKAIFPPPDTKIQHLTIERKKNDYHGLGWVGNESLEMALNRVRNSNSTTPQVSRDGKERPQRDQDGDDDDDDNDDDLIKSTSIYGGQDDIRKSSLNLSNRERIRLGMQEKDTHDRPNHEQKREQNLVQRDANTWSDGRPVLKGFRISTKSQVPEAWHEPPPVPKGWKPDPSRVWNMMKPDENSRPSDGNLGPEQRGDLLGEARIPGPPPSIQDYVKRPPNLNNQVSTSTSKSNSNNSSTGSGSGSAAKTPLPTLEASVASSALKGFLPFSNDLPKQKRYLDFLHFHSNHHAAADSEAEAGTGVPRREISKAENQSQAEFHKELEDFVKMAKVFKPLSTAMSNRFTSGSDPQGKRDDLGDLPKSGLYQPKFQEEEEKKKEEEKEKEKEKKSRRFETTEEKIQREERERKELEESLSPAQRAARDGRFGRETRTMRDWYPNKLLLKRFNVPDPHSESRQNKNGNGNDGQDQQMGKEASEMDDFPSAFGSTNMARDKAKSKSKSKETDLFTPKLDSLYRSKKRELEELVKVQSWNQFTDPSASTNQNQNQDAKVGSAEKVDENGGNGSGNGNGNGNPRISLENVGLGEDENQGRDIVDYVKPEMSIFKAVFGDDDDSDDELEEGVEQGRDGAGEGEGGGAGGGSKEKREGKERDQEKKSRVDHNQDQGLGNQEANESGGRLKFKPKVQRSLNKEKFNQVSTLDDLDQGRGMDPDAQQGPDGSLDMSDRSLHAKGRGKEKEKEKEKEREREGSKSKGKKKEKEKKKKSKGGGMLTFDLDGEGDEDSMSSSKVGFKLDKRKLNNLGGFDADTDADAGAGADAGATATAGGGGGRGGKTEDELKEERNPKRQKASDLF